LVRPAVAPGGIGLGARTPQLVECLAACLEHGTDVRPLRVAVEDARQEIIDGDVAGSGLSRKPSDETHHRETMLMMRPNPRVIIPSTVSRIISIGESIIASSAALRSSRDQSRKSPGAGPSALLRRISGCGQAASAAERPAPVVMSAATVVTL